MMSNAYTFCLLPAEKTLLGEVSAALRVYVEDASRKKLPKLWLLIDQQNKQANQSGGRTAFMSALCLGLGIFLLVPGLVNPRELMVPLVVGALAVGAGIGGFVRLRREKKALLKNRFDRGAKKLLSQRNLKTGSTVVFYENEADLGERVRYKDLDLVLETAALYLIFWQGRVLMLQKSELTKDDSLQFSAFIQSQVRDYRQVEA